MSDQNQRKAKITPETKAESARLRAIWEASEYKLSQAAFGERYAIGSQPAVGFFLNGQTPLSLKAAQGFARGLRCEIKDFSPRLAVQANSIADSVKRFDNAFEGARESQLSYENVRPAAKRGSVPVISSVRAGSWGQINDHIPDTDRTVEARYSSPSKHAFALEVEGDSMVAASGPSFPAGTVIVVEPERAPKPGDYVVAKDVATRKGTFKKLMSDGARWYLKPLNRDYPTLELDDPAQRVIGVVIEYWTGGKL